MLFLYALAESLMDKATSKIFGMIELEPFDWLFLFTVVILFLISYECKRVLKQLGFLWEKIWGKIGWETRKEKWEREEKQKQSEWEREQKEKQAKWEKEKAEAEAEKEDLLGIIGNNIDFLRRRMIQPPEEHDFDAYMYGLPTEDYYQEMIRQTMHKLKKYKFSVPAKEEIALEGFDDCWRKFLIELRIRIRAGDWKDHPNLWEEFKPKNRNES